MNKSEVAFHLTVTALEKANLPVQNEPYTREMVLERAQLVAACYQIIFDAVPDFHTGEPKTRIA
ncbi:MAG: hypothetical protein WC683_04480 [bacterium]